MKRAILRDSFFSMNWSGSKFFTSAAIWQANCDASKLVIRSTPLFPASSACQTSGAVFPTAQMVPIPVTTTRRCKLLGSFRVRVDVFHRVLYRADLLRILVGNLDFEGLFKGHNQLDRVKRVSAEVIHERSVGRYFALVHAQLLHDDLLYPFFHGCHEVSNLLSLRRALGAPGRTGALLLGLGVLLNVAYGVLHSADLLRVFVRDLDLEGFFESHDQFDRIERIGPKIVHEGRGGRNLRIIYSKLLHNDLLNPFFSRSHRFLLSRRTWCRGGQTHKCNC